MAEKEPEVVDPAKVKALLESCRQDNADKPIDYQFLVDFLSKNGKELQIDQESIEKGL